jgi:hypothetical protein
MDATSFYLTQQLHRLASQARSAAHQVRSATTLRQVRDFGHQVIPGYLSATARTLPEVRQLHQAQEARAGELVDADLARLAAISGQTLPAADRLAQMKAAYGSLTQHHWVFLRGEHPGILARATREAERMLGQLRSQARSEDSLR